MTTNTISYPSIIRQFCTLLLLVAVISSCNKTEYETLKRPYNTIEGFSIAGYHALDSINGVISEDEIKVYWSAEAARPATIKPTIALSPGATISPASGQAVPFSESTVYTVTAEDGTAKEYKLKPVVNTAIPVLTALDNFVAWQWATIDQLKINGEYFLNSGGAANIRAYAQRLRDGYEFDLEVDKEKTIGTQLVLDLPKFTAEQDTGLHRIYVKVGDFPSNSLDTYIGLPVLSNISTSLTLKEAGKTFYVGDTLTLTINLSPKIDMDQFTKYFSKNNLNNIQFNYGFNTTPTATPYYSSANYTSSGIIMEGNQLKVPFVYGTTLPERWEPLFTGGTYINKISVYFTYDYSYYGASYKQIRETSSLPIPGTIFAGPILGPHFNNEWTVYADETTRKKTILAKR